MEETPRRIAKIMKPQPVVEGAGVRLRRSVATRSLDYLDPFLLGKARFGAKDQTIVTEPRPMARREHAANIWEART